MKSKIPLEGGRFPWCLCPLLSPPPRSVRYLFKIPLDGDIWGDGKCCNRYFVYVPLRPAPSAATAPGAVAEDQMIYRRAAGAAPGRAACTGQPEKKGLLRHASRMRKSRAAPASVTLSENPLRGDGCGPSRCHAFWTLASRGIKASRPLFVAVRARKSRTGRRLLGESATKGRERFFHLLAASIQQHGDLEAERLQRGCHVRRIIDRIL